MRILAAFFTGAMVLCSIVLAAENECQSGYGFSHCKLSNLVFVLDDKNLTLRAIDIVNKTEKWKTNIQADQVSSNLAATRACVSFSVGAIPDAIYGYSTSTGTPIWTRRSKTMNLASASSFILADNGIGLGAVLALDDRTGNIRWRYSEKGRIFARFLATSDSTALTNLFAIDAKSGRILGRWGDQGRITVAAFSGNSPITGSSLGVLTKYAGDKMLREVWSRQLFPRQEISVLASDHQHIVAVSYSNPEFFTPSVAHLRVLSAAGNALWEKEIRITGKSLPSSAAVTSSLVLFVKGDAKKPSILGFDAENGNLKWTLESPVALREGIVCHAGRCLIGSDSGDVFIVDTATGKGELLSSVIQNTGAQFIASH